MGSLASVFPDQEDVSPCSTPPNATSLALQNPDDSRDEILRRYSYGVAMPAICCLGVLGNILNLVVLTRRNMKGIAYIYMRGKYPFQVITAVLVEIIIWNVKPCLWVRTSDVSKDCVAFTVRSRIWRRVGLPDCWILRHHVLSKRRSYLPKERLPYPGYFSSQYFGFLQIRCIFVWLLAIKNHEDKQKELWRHEFCVCWRWQLHSLYNVEWHRHVKCHAIVGRIKLSSGCLHLRDKCICLWLINVELGINEILNTLRGTPLSPCTATKISPRMWPSKFSLRNSTPQLYQISRFSLLQAQGGQLAIHNIQPTLTWRTSGHWKALKFSHQFRDSKTSFLSLPLLQFPRPFVPLFTKL